PSNGAVFDTQPVQLSWSEIPGARYEVEIQRCTTDGTNCVTNMILVNATSHSLSVATSAQINWRVRALLPDGSTTAFTPYRSFKVFLGEPTITPVPVLALIGPSNNATFDTQPVQLSWSEMPGARYEVEIQRCTTDGTNCVTDMILVNATSHSLSVAASAQINWRVRALLPDGSFTAFTPYRSFKVFLTLPTATPTPVLALIAPADGVTFTAQPVQLSWSALPGTASYSIEIQRCATDATNCVVENIVTSNSSLALSLTASAHINWRVRATFTDGSTTAFTSYRSFKVFLTGPTATPSPRATAAMVRATPTQTPSR
ncbi:MAG: hypothetical protein J0L63_16615, partial [Anaerolineae bacterium]|nr:hypothetical protein [Anaerolineae bacterium]